MLRSLLALAAATAIALTGVVLSPPASAAAADDVLLPTGDVITGQQLEQVRGVFDGINAYRARLDAGLEPLRFAPDLFDLAQRWSEQMVEHDTLTHRYQHWLLYPPGSSGGEIIAARTNADVGALVRQWIDSPAHEQLLRSDKATVMGAGVTVDSADTARYFMYSAVNFGAYEDGEIPIYDSIDDWIHAGAVLARDDVVGGLHRAEADGAGRITVEGWALDFSRLDLASTVVVTIGGVRSVSVVADDPLWQWGADDLRAGHDFRASFTAEAGSTQRVCAVAKNSFGPGQDRSLGCRDVVVPIPAERLAGANRYDTAVAVSARYNDPADVDTVYLATGAKYPDALSLAPAAAQDGHALLLTPTSQLWPSVAAELARLTPLEIIVVGAEDSVSAHVLEQARDAVPGVSITRLAGADRYETSVKIAEHAFPDATRAYVASGALFPDALSAAPVAAAMGAPVILTPHAALPQSARDYFTASGVSAVVVAGGEPSVSAAVAAELDALVGAPPERIAGDDRYETNRALAASLRAGAADEVLLASGQNFPDALAGAAIAADAGPLLLTRRGCVPKETVDAILGVYSPQLLVVLGGEPTLAPAVAELSSCG
jgi:putative cell wall-binding protein/uncharacterized protein YkwD